MISRRKFIVHGVAGLTGASLFAPSLLRSEPARRISKIGFQSWIVREDIGKDLAGTLRKMGTMGYNSIEMCSPPGYAKLGFGPLEDLSASEMRVIFNDNGFTCESCHYGLAELKD